MRYAICVTRCVNSICVLKNPFEYGSIVEAEAFCNRKQELTDITRAVENTERLFLFAERRMGKTSLIKMALQRLPKDRFIKAYIDLWPTDSDSSFISAFASAITEAASTTPQKMLEFARGFFSRLAPSISLDAEGKPQVNFGLTPAGNVEQTLEEVLLAPGQIAEKTKQTVVIALDEAQQLFEYETDLVERHLRSAMQQQRNVAYILSGSRKHLIQKMVLDRTRPLYRAGRHYPLEPIAEYHWLGFIQERFTQSSKTIERAQISSIFQLTEGHPFYTQHLCHALWEVTETNGAVTTELTERALDLVLAREAYAYTTLWDSFTLSQRRFLEGLAREPAGARIFGADFLDKYELKSASTVQRAVKGLLEKDIVDKSGDTYYILDRFFHLWIQRKHE